MMERQIDSPMPMPLGLVFAASVLLESVAVHCSMMLESISRRSKRNNSP